MGQKASQRIEQYSRIEVYVFKVSWQLVIFSFGEVSIYHTHKYIHTVYFADMSIKHTLCVCMYICVCGICMYMASVYSLTHMCVHVHPYTHTHTHTHTHSWPGISYIDKVSLKSIAILSPQSSVHWLNLFSGN